MLEDIKYIIQVFKVEAIIIAEKCTAFHYASFLVFIKMTKIYIKKLELKYGNRDTANN